MKTTTINKQENYFDRLPLDMIVEIFSYLDFQSSINLSIASKSLYSVYHTVQKFQPDSDFWKKNMQLFFPQLKVVKDFRREFIFNYKKDFGHIHQAARSILPDILENQFMSPKEKEQLFLKLYNEPYSDIFNCDNPQVVEAIQAICRNVNPEILKQNALSIQLKRKDTSPVILYRKMLNTPDLKSYVKVASIQPAVLVYIALRYGDVSLAKQLMNIVTEFNKENHDYPLINYSETDAFHTKHINFSALPKDNKEINQIIINQIDVIRQFDFSSIGFDHFLKQNDDNFLNFLTFEMKTDAQKLEHWLKHKTFFDDKTLFDIQSLLTKKPSIIEEVVGHESLFARALRHSNERLRQLFINTKLDSFQEKNRSYYHERSQGSNYNHSVTLFGKKMDIPIGVHKKEKLDASFYLNECFDGKKSWKDLYRLHGSAFKKGSNLGNLLEKVEETRSLLNK